jgi:hypothetical protein
MDFVILVRRKTESLEQYSYHSTSERQLHSFQIINKISEVNKISTKTQNLIFVQKISWQRSKEEYHKLGVPPAWPLTTLRLYKCRPPRIRSRNGPPIAMTTTKSNVCIELGYLWGSMFIKVMVRQW